MSDGGTDIAKRMRALADSGHARAADLRRLADEFDASANGFFAEPQTVPVKKFMGAWARARRCWCECTGEELI